ncbi:MAG TPA: RecX family transcriptional regulator [Candidatus Dormibacteraeota bacterium]|nr:RecX family transcriptional regulator [Candidatus Dormibacteraeota bacterium]
MGRRAHSRAELDRKLGRRGYPETDVRSAIDRLVELGYLDDRAFAESHVRRRQVGRGPRALSAELSARGVDRQVADIALSGFDGEAQLLSAIRLAERLRGGKAHAGYREVLEAIGPKLLRRGFSSGVARAACRAVWSGTSPGTEA